MSRRRSTHVVALIATTALVFACAPQPSPTALSEPAPGNPTNLPGTTVPVAAAALPTTPVVVREPWTWDGGAAPIVGETLITSHFQVHTTLREGALKATFPIFAETALEHYTTVLGRLPAPSQPLESFIFGSREQWSDYTKKRLGDEADVYLALGRGGYTMDAQSVLYDLGRWDTLALASHEGWHQYTQATFKQALPIWLEEGLATYMEGHRWSRGEDRPTFAPWRNFERFGELREAARADELIPLDELLDGVPQKFLRRDGRSKLLTYYAQVWALSQFLAEGENGRYRGALEQLLRDAVAGRISNTVSNSPHLPPGRARHMATKVGKAVVLVYFNPDFADFKKGYDEFVDSLLQRGSGDAIWRGESPLKAKAD